MIYFRYLKWLETKKINPPSFASLNRVKEIHSRFKKNEAEDKSKKGNDENDDEMEDCSEEVKEENENGGLSEKETKKLDSWIYREEVSKFK